MEEPGDRLKKARENAGYKSAADAATSLGVSYSTYIGHENNSRGLRRDAAQLYARKYKVSIDWLLTGRDASAGAPVTNGISATKGREGVIGMVPVLGSVRASYWQEVSDGGAFEMSEMVPSSGGYPVDWQVAYRVDGNCLNKIASDGDTLVCVDLIKSGLSIENGDLVIIERTRYGGEMVQRTAKRVRRTSAGFELWPESDDPAHQEPIVLNDMAEHDEVRVAAKVLWILRKP